MTETTETTETCERCANRDPRDRRDHGHVPTETIPPLASSITHQLTDLAAHATVHGHHDALAGEEPDEMPPCLADHVASLAATLFGLTRPEEANSTISTTVEFPIDLSAPELPDDLPEGLIEGLQKAVGALAESLGKRS